jgi:hypothetical protein
VNSSSSQQVDQTGYGIADAARGASLKIALNRFRNFFRTQAPRRVIVTSFNNNKTGAGPTGAQLVFII